MTPEGARRLTIRAYAKLNLSLDVLGLRPDGYHELRSVLQTISLHDTLTLYLGEADSGKPNHADYYLVDQAVDAVTRATHSSQVVTYALDKRIPPGAGLGGGSSDCAAALRGTARLLGHELPESALAEMAASLGSDVPFFLVGGTALVEGRGERVRPLVDLPTRWFVLGGQKTRVSTAEVFGAFLDTDRGDGKASDRVLASISEGTIAFGGNDLTDPALRRFPQIRSTFDRLSQVAATRNIAMSGSGGTVAALFDGKDSATSARVALQATLPWLDVASSIGRAQALYIE